jgi:integrase
MILVAYRHGLRASEVCDLQWQQIELSEGRLHVHRVKNGTPSVHPIRGDEMRTLRKLLATRNGTGWHDGVRYPRSSSFLTSAARCGGTGVARASYWSLRHFPIANIPTRLPPRGINLV